MITNIQDTIDAFISKSTYLFINIHLLIKLHNFHLFILIFVLVTLSVLQAQKTLPLPASAICVEVLFLFLTQKTHAMKGTWVFMLLEILVRAHKKY